MRATRARRRPAVILAASAALGLLCPAARAEDAVALPDAPAPADAGAVVVEDTAPAAVRYTGRIVSQLSLVAPEGGLPAESLEPLLRVQQDVPYSPQAVRQDIAMLHRVLDFAQVEVHVEDWVAFDAQGEPVPAVRVEYRVFPPPRLRAVRIRGAHALSRRELLGVLGRETGDPFFPAETSEVRGAVEGAYAAIGYPDAKARVSAEMDKDQRVLLTVDVTEGEPDRLLDIRIRAGGSLSELEIRWILARNKLGRGRPWTESALRKAREELNAALRDGGHYEGRVALQLDPTDITARRLVVIVDPRRKWDVVRAGRGFPSKREIVERLGLRDGVRISRRFGEEAARTLTEDLRGQSYLDANVAVAVEESDQAVVVRVTGDAGARHRLGDAVWEGTPVYSDAYLTAALKEASPDRIGRGRASPDAVDAALEVLQEFYRSQGYLSARLAREAFAERARPPTPPALTGVARAFGFGRVVPVDLVVAVEAGPRATLARLVVEGEVGEVDAPAIFADLVGQPLNPSEIDTRVRRLVEALNEGGYLSADARAATVLADDGTAADVTVTVSPGPVVYLRSVILRGHRRARRAVVEREIDLAPGDPLAPSRVSGIRRRLYELDLFSRVSAELVGDEDRAKDLIVEVEERPNLHAELGGGVATDQGVKVFARGGHRNLFGLGHRVTLLGQAGVGWVGDDWALDVLAPEWKAAARYEAPNIPGRGDHVALDLVFNEQEQEPSYRLERSGAGLGVLLHLGDTGTAELAYRVEARRLLDIDPGAVVPGDPWLDELVLTDLADPAPSLPSAIRYQSGLDLSFVLDLRDDPFNPTKGGVGTLLVTVTDEILSDLSFVRGEASWSWWVPLAGFGLQGRVRGGAAWVPAGLGTLPLEDRFRLGGGANLRGFALDSVGPANEVSREDIPFPEQLAPLVGFGGLDEPSRWVATGGDAMALASLEMRVPFEKLGLSAWTGTQLAFFVDAGNVWFLRPDIADSVPTDPLLRWSAGVGLRRATAIGPIQVDVGFNPERLRDEAFWQIHVTLGAL